LAIILSHDHAVWHCHYPLLPMARSQSIGGVEIQRKEH
jgi:hypothetical protein